MRGDVHRQSLRHVRSLDDFAARKLEERDREGLRRTLVPVERAGRVVRHGGREGPELVNFASNDYLGLSRHPAVIAAAKEGASRGAGATASRLVVGHDRDMEALESELAGLKGTQAATLFGSGYHANLGVIPAVVGPGDAIVIDGLAHACLRSGARLSRAHVHVVPHNRVDAASEWLHANRSAYRNVLLVTEGVFSMDGDLAPLDGWAQLGWDLDAWLLVDDAHGTGVTGRGRGTVRQFGLSGTEVPLQIGTLSKALGGYGGFLGSSQVVAQLMPNRARTLVYSTGLPPSAVFAARAAVRLVQEVDGPRQRLERHGFRLAEALDLPSPRAAIVPIELGQPERALEAQARLAEAGLWVPAMRAPTVPDGTDRLRVSLSAAHTEEDVERLIDGLKDVLGRGRRGG